MPLKVWTHYSWIFSSPICVNQSISFVSSETILMSTSWGSSHTVVVVSKYYSVSFCFHPASIGGKHWESIPIWRAPSYIIMRLAQQSFASVLSPVGWKCNTFYFGFAESSCVLDVLCKPATVVSADRGLGWCNLLKASWARAGGWGRSARLWASSALDRFSLGASTLLLNACCFCTELKRKNSTTNKKAQTVEILASVFENLCLNMPREKPQRTCQRVAEL